MTAIDKKKCFQGLFSQWIQLRQALRLRHERTPFPHTTVQECTYTTPSKRLSATRPHPSTYQHSHGHTHIHTVDWGLPSEWVPFTLLLVPCGYCVCLWQSLFLPLISTFPACLVFSLNPWTVQYVLSYGRVKTNNNDDRIFILTGNQMWLYTRVHYMVFMLLWRSSALKSLKVQINSDYKWTCFLFGCT